MIHHHLVTEQEMRRLANLFVCFSFSLPVDSFFSEEVKHVFHGLRPARGLALFVIVICGLPCVLQGARWLRTQLPKSVTQERCLR